jgi:hypothetical protein
MTHKNSLLGLVFGVLAFTSSIAQASLIEFSYLFDDGTAIEGTFNGDVFGNSVINVSDLTMSINGNAAGSMNIWSYYGLAPYEISFDSTLNNFWFADAAGWNGPNGGDGAYGFALIGSAVTTAYALSEGNNLAWVVDTPNSVAAPAYPGLSMNNSWSLNVVQATVPEPTTLAIFSLGLMGLASRRFKKQS